MHRDSHNFKVPENITENHNWNTSDERLHVRPDGPHTSYDHVGETNENYRTQNNLKSVHCANNRITIV